MPKMGALILAGSIFGIRIDFGYTPAKRSRCARDIVRRRRVFGGGKRYLASVEFVDVVLVVAVVSSWSRVDLESVSS
jgi:hypothetical protein